MTSSMHSTGKDTTVLSITVYNNHFGVVKEKRAITLSPDCNQVIYMDVAAKIETDSLMLKGITVHEMNYDYDLVNKVKLFEKYIDRTVYLLNENGARQACRLLSVHGGMVLEDDATKELYIDPAGEIVLPKLPDGLIVKPALVWKIPPQQTDAIEVSYITAGLEWKSNYVIELAGPQCHLSGWVEITNQTGTTFTDAKLKLIAGDVRRVERDDDIRPLYVMEDRQYSAIAEPSFSEEEFADYHMYKLDRPITMKNEQTKQIQFFHAPDVPCDLYYECRTGSGKATTYLELQNRVDRNLGLPLPKGIVKVYQRDEADDQLEFIGEDEIDHTPRNETLRLALGEAFDLVCEHDLKNRTKRGGKTVEKHEVILKNRKSGEANVHLRHYVPHRHWDMATSTHPYTKESGNTLLFQIRIGADTEMKLAFEIEIDDSINVRFN